MVPSRTSLSIILLLVATVVATGTVGAAPPPRPLCDACGDTFEETAEDFGLNVEVTNSTAHVIVHENGTATWTVRNDLAAAPAVERLRSNETLRTNVADRAMWDTDLLGATVSSEGVLTMRYREPAFASEAVGGAWYTGEFTAAYGYRNLHGLGADHLTLVAPPGTRIERTVPGATMAADGRRMTLTSLERGDLVTFVPEDSPIGPVLSMLTVASVLGPVVLVNIAFGVIIPTAVFTILFAAIAGAVSWLDPAPETIRDAAGPGLTAVGALLLGGVLLQGVGVFPLGGLDALLLGLSVAFLALGAGLAGWPKHLAASFRRLCLVAGVAVSVGLGVTVVAANLLSQHGLSQWSASSLPFIIPVLVALPAGYALGRENRRLGLGTAALAFGVVWLPRTALLVPTSAPRFYSLAFATVSALFVALVGTPVLVVGRAIAKTE